MGETMLRCALHSQKMCLALAWDGLTFARDGLTIAWNDLALEGGRLAFALKKKPHRFFHHFLTKKRKGFFQEFFTKKT